jgi:hypothetical protein
VKKRYRKKQDTTTKKLRPLSTVRLIKLKTTERCKDERSITKNKHEWKNIEKARSYYVPFRDTPTACRGDTLAQIYEQTMFRLERITQAGYQVKAQWECEIVIP